MTATVPPLGPFAAALGSALDTGCASGPQASRESPAVTPFIGV